MKISEYDSAKLVIIMVGLPARGKSYMSQKIARYFTWRGFSSKIFNVGQVRRSLLPKNASVADFFDPANHTAVEEREIIATTVFSSLIEWISTDGRVGIYDATNTTAKRRKHLIDMLRNHGSYDVLFLESICDDPLIIDRNIRTNKVKQPLYQNMQPEEAVQDFYARIRHYESVYETVTESENIPFVKFIDFGEKIQLYKIHGYLPSRLVYFVMNMHTEHRSIYLCRHGESEMNAIKRIGGDSSLTERGRSFSRKLTDYINSQALKVWSSTLKRTVETASPLADSYSYTAFKALDEIDAGICDSMTYEEIKEKHPEIHCARKKDKFNYRGPCEPDYSRIRADIVFCCRCRSQRRYKSFALIDCGVSHVLDFMGLDKSTIPHLDIPLHTITDDEFNCYSVAREIRFSVDDDQPPEVVSVDHGNPVYVEINLPEFNKKFSPPPTPSSSMTDLSMWKDMSPGRSGIRSTPIS